jgi:hypothetical protein
MSNESLAELYQVHLARWRSMLVERMEAARPARSATRTTPRWRTSSSPSRWGRP